MKLCVEHPVVARNRRFTCIRLNPASFVATRVSKSGSLTWRITILVIRWRNCSSCGVSFPEDRIGFPDRNG
jgi:hypothetical protein